LGQGSSYLLLAQSIRPTSAEVPRGNAMEDRDATRSPMPSSRPSSSGAEAINIQAFLDTQPVSRFQWVLFTLCFLTVLLDGFDTGAVGFVAPSLLKEWSVDKPALAPVLSGALFGLAAGALFAGPLADRFGRKRVLVISVAIFGLASLACAFAATLMQLTIMRFVTGIGLGAAMPNAVTLMSEYCPVKRRATLTNAMFCGFPLGAALGGFVAAWMIPHLGFRSVFLLGGVTPLILSVAAALLLPESVRYLIAKQAPLAKLRKALMRVSPQAAQAQSFSSSDSLLPAAASSGGLRLVLSRSYLVGSVALWLAYFMGLVIFYALINWMPILLRDAGLPPQRATLVSALFPLGGVGAVFAGYLMDRFNATRVVAVAYALTAVTVYFVGQSVANVGALVTAVFVAGTMMNTAQSSLPTLAAAFYPTQGRATGVAWMMGIGRFGGIFGSFLVAELSRRQLGFGTIFAIVAVPGLLAAAALLIKQLTDPRAPNTTLLHQQDGQALRH
jgi:AAHS family 4-hydroxybenzoate transporter-like MFS transporter